MLQTLEALQFANSQKPSVTHRDLKPSNIFITHSGAVKLIDFGIARPEDSGATTTAATSFQGTWDFMAPDFVHEQGENFRGDEQSDIYSFGVCFYQVLTGRLPYPELGGNPQISYVARCLAPKPPEVDYQRLQFLSRAKKTASAAPSR